MHIILSRIQNFILISSLFFFSSVFALEIFSASASELSPSEISQGHFRSELDKIIIASSEKQRNIIRRHMFQELPPVANSEPYSKDKAAFFNAIMTENYDIIKQCALYYKKNGALSRVYDQGKTPLFVAIQNKRILSAITLLKQGGNPNAENIDLDQEKPMDAALNLSDPQIATVMALSLLDYGARPNEIDSENIERLLISQRARIMGQPNCISAKNEILKDASPRCDEQSISFRLSEEFSNDEKQAEMQEDFAFDKLSNNTSNSKTKRRKNDRQRDDKLPCLPFVMNCSDAPQLSPISPLVSGNDGVLTSTQPMTNTAFLLARLHALQTIRLTLENNLLLASEIFRGSGVSPNVQNTSNEPERQQKKRKRQPQVNNYADALELNVPPVFLPSPQPIAAPIIPFPTCDSEDPNQAESLGSPLFEQEYWNEQTFGETFDIFSAESQGE